MGTALRWMSPAIGRPDWDVTVVRQSADMDDSAAGRALETLDDTRLAEAAADGQPGAFDLIVERHGRAVYQLCYRFVNNHEDARDLAQDVFLRAYRALRKFRGQSALATWLHRIAINACLNRVSANTPDIQPLEDDRHVDTSSEPVSNRVLREERAARVRAAIARLPRKQRATLILRLYHEMSHQEIADSLGTTVGAAKANFFHALGNLKKLLGEDIL